MFGCMYLSIMLRTYTAVTYYDIMVHSRYDSVLASCWEELPMKRPSFKDIVHTLDNILTDSSVRR